ncbi:MAG: tetratricopeptide repeat protein [Pseudomonadota bacterium]
MKNYILTATLAVSAALAGATAAHAGETFADPTIADGLAAFPAALQETVSDCLNGESSSRAIRACSKTIRASVPNDELRAHLYTRRALHKMALGRFDDAASDFSRAGNLSGNSDLGSLGQGFAAMMDKDLTTAQASFRMSAEDAATAPLAEYGLGLTHQMAGETDEARNAYERALTLRPGWDAVTERMDALDPQ